VFATLNADRILEDCRDIDCVGVGEGEELLPEYRDHLDDPSSVAGLVWRRDGQVVADAPRPLLRDDDERDWNKWFKCSDIAPTTLASAAVNRLRASGYGLRFLHRILRRPFRTWKLLRAFSRHMKLSDLVKLFPSPFRRRTLTRKPELPARMIDSGLGDVQAR
jgi:hypothetical protein